MFLPSFFLKSVFWVITKCYSAWFQAWLNFFRCYLYRQIIIVLIVEYARSSI